MPFCFTADELLEFKTVFFYKRVLLSLQVTKVNLKEYKKAKKTENLIISKNLYMFHDECVSSVKQSKYICIRERLQISLLLLNEFKGIN